MPEIARHGNYVVRLYHNDHPPSHVHVVFGKCEVRVIVAHTGASLDRAFGNPKAQEVRRALEIVVMNIETCLEKWEEFHG